MKITSSSNERLKEIKKLLKSSRHRYEKGRYIVEGIRMFKEIPKDILLEIYVSETGYESYKNIIDNTKIEPFIIADNIYAGISDTITPQGIMGVAAIRSKKIEDVFPDHEPAFLVIAEKLHDPGNLGTIIRTSEGAGVTGVIVSKDSVDIYNPKTIRATMGSIFRVPIYISDNLTNDIAYVKEKGVMVYAAHLKGECFYNRDYTGSCGFLIGNEGNGLSGEIGKAADCLIKIPMCGRVESLNAGISTSVIAYEVMRQRKFV